jgi:hypothetical protein
MLSASRFNYLIEMTQKLIVSVTNMRLAYDAFPVLVAEEHRMILAHTYTPRLEEICAEKTSLAEQITAGFEELQQLAQQIFNIWGDVECEGVAAYPGDLTNCIGMLEGILQAVRDKNSDLATNVLSLQIRRLRDELDLFRKTASNVKPSLELNRSALNGVVRSYQDSTRALIDLCEQAQATYSSQGTQNKSSSGTSTIFVRA